MSSEAAVLNLTREKGDSTTLEVRKCFQFSSLSAQSQGGQDRGGELGEGDDL